MTLTRRPAAFRVWAVVAGLCAALVVSLGLVQSASAAPAWPAIANGTTGANVTTAQYLLRSHGYDVAVDSDFGPATENTVVAFQKDKGFAADGVVGAETWPGLVVTVREGDSGDAVKAAQTALNKYGYGLAVDGEFGAATASAATKFQQDKGLSADGVIGAETWQYLMGQGGGDDGGGCTVPDDPDPDVLKGVYQKGVELGVSDRVMLAGFEAGVVESNMNNLDCGDRDSLGVFQQRPSQGWGTPEQIQDVAYASNAFFTRAVDVAADNPDLTAGQVAQKVQVSAYPDRYDAVEGTARELIERAKGL
ncbi:peptidoglycan-binding domain-containing protein [Streptomyces nanshensis]|uniref:Peptidoglycan-binding protein n=1 Tax=Streptomyces nanshensis TaxID=518642 RepID=A0A1E7LBN0_9ACTN|nr:peptidoglycan-binding protein [Streptomyces nanshensis]OEV13639.1 peptidoglycan-binding protein [Streptomyces nanshensis]